MNGRLKNSLALVIALAALVASGCGDTPVETVSQPAAPTPFDTAAAKAKAATEATELAAEVKPEAPKPRVQAEPELASYQAPFPERHNLFAPKKQAARAAKQSRNDSADSVVLMGFANLDTPRVVLAIDGIVKPLSHGEEIGGVTVISIDPPRAVLQRGRSRWTASIE